MHFWHPSAYAYPGLQARQATGGRSRYFPCAECFVKNISKHQDERKERSFGGRGFKYAIYYMVFGFDIPDARSA